MEKELIEPHSSVIVDLGILDGLTWSFSTVRLISAVEEVISSSIEPVRRNLFHLFFFAQRFIRFSTPEITLSLYHGHEPRRSLSDTVPLTHWRR